MASVLRSNASCPCKQVTDGMSLHGFFITGRKVEHFYEEGGANENILTFLSSVFSVRGDRAPFRLAADLRGGV